jgi:hypothetical protein
MTKSELIKALDEIGVDRKSYSLDDGVAGIILEKTTNHYGDNKEYDVWNVYEVDRGRVGESFFFRKRSFIRYL